MAFMAWLGAGSLIGAGIATVLTGGAAAPALVVAAKVGAVGAGAGAVGAGALLGAGAGAVAGAVFEGQHRATDHIFYDGMGYQDEPRIEVEHFRWHLTDMEECKEECEEEVYWQHSQFFWNNNNVTQFQSVQNPEETQETRTHHNPKLPSPCPILTRRMIELMKKKEEKENEMNNEAKIRIMSANVCSLEKRAPMVRREIEDKQVDVACLTETFSKDANADTVLADTVPGFVYQFKNSDAFENRARRGVANLYSEHLQVSEAFNDTLNRLRFENFEFVSSVVKHDKWNAPILVICLYRPPKYLSETVIDDFLGDLKCLLDSSLKNHKHIIVTGDFNIPEAKMNAFNWFLNRYHLQQHVNQPTYDSGNILDLVVTKNVQVSNLSVGSQKMHDHYPVFFDAQPKPPSDK